MRHCRRLFAKLKNLFGRGRAEREMSREVSAHLTLLEDEFERYRESRKWHCRFSYRRRRIFRQCHLGHKHAGAQPATAIGRGTARCLRS